MPRRVIFLLAGLLLAPPVAHAATLTLYAAQHEQTVDMLTKAFTHQTGIEVRIREGEAPELASQLLARGGRFTG